MTDCLKVVKVKGPYPKTIICFLQIHVVLVNQDHQTAKEIVVENVGLKQGLKVKNMFPPV